MVAARNRDGLLARIAVALREAPASTLGCIVTPPRDIDGLQIENSDLRQVDGSHKLELKLSLRNRVDVALAYPALELTLLDDKNNVAIRRVLWPQDYARPGTQIRGRPAARAARRPVIVRLDTGDAVAANFAYRFFIRDAATRSRLGNVSFSPRASVPDARSSSEHLTQFWSRQHESSHPGWQPDRSSRHVPARRASRRPRSRWSARTSAI